MSTDSFVTENHAISELLLQVTQAVLASRSSARLGWPTLCRVAYLCGFDGASTLSWEQPLKRGVKSLNRPS